VTAIWRDPNGSVLAALLVAGITLLWVDEVLARRTSPLRVLKATRTHLYLAGAGTAFLNSLEPRGTT
jgi:hypothetical protein